MEILKPDICVIGGGSAGLSVAAAAAAFGVPAVLIENHKMGGDCLNTGCVPSKALLAAAASARSMRTGAPFGVTADDVDIDFVKVRDHVRGVIAAIAPVDSAERFTGLGVRVIKGHAAFKDGRTVAVDGKFEIRARRFVIATGSTPALPPIPGLDSGPYAYQRIHFRPRRLAGASHRHRRRPDRHRAGAGVPPSRQRGYRVRGDAAARQGRSRNARPSCSINSCAKASCCAAASRLFRSPHGAGTVTLTIESVSGETTSQEKIEGTHLLVAAGRKPTVDGLGLEAAGIRFEKSGIAVDKKLKTSNRRVYAIGDCAAGQLQFTHAANYHAGLVIRSALFRLPVKVNNDVIPWVTYTEPELAQTGLSEAEARKRGHKIRILRWPYHDNDRAQTERTTHGHIKVITTAKGGILGATIVGAQAGELITALDAGDHTKAQYPRHDRHRRALSDFVGDRKTCGHRLFHAKFDEALGAAHHIVLANLRLRLVLEPVTDARQRH